MSTILPRQKNVKLDEVFTPKEAIYPLLPFLPKGCTIWECAAGTGELARHFREEGFKVIEGEDFFSELFNSDVIVTNPPYSKKDAFLKRAYEIGRPFAFLLPLTALEGKTRGSLYRLFGIQLIIPNKRINFIVPSGKKSAWFQTAWFTTGLNLTKDLNFVDLKSRSD
jgi:23S rRNA G2445 N2-methylase RlmL